MMQTAPRPARSINVASDPSSLFQSAAAEFIRAGNSAFERHGQFTVALSGGSTPKGLYSSLASGYSGFDWGKTFFFFGDERHVPPTDDESNYRMVNESLFTKAPIPATNVFRFATENADANAAASDYELQLRRFFKLTAGGVPRFDMILLGVGPDGHTASLFPGTAALEERSRLVVANWVAKFNTDRLTFTYPVLNNAAEVMFLASGADKADIVHEILETSPHPPLPSQGVQPRDGTVLWMLDEAAAAKIVR